MKIVPLLIFVLCSVQWVDSLKILGVFGTPTFSHYSVGKSITDELVKKGHDVTLVGPFPEKDAKFKHIFLDGSLQKMEDMRKEMNFFELEHTSKILGVPFVHQMGLDLTKQTFHHPEFKKLISSNEKFDLVIFEQFVNDAHRGICHHYKAPCVIISPLEANYWSNIPTGNPENPSYVSTFTLGHVGPMNFYNRLVNSVYSVLVEIYVKLWALPQQDKLMRTVFPEAPPLNELIYEPALYLMNSHVSTAPPVPLLPNMIEIGGYHVKPPQKLPEDLHKYLDDAKEGVVYFSMGSNLASKNFPMEKRKALLEAFGKLKVKVLWKFEEDLPEKPANVKISKWLPQKDILAHPNVKLFITHGGLLSTIEAIYHGVPVIGIPIYGDQSSNMERATHSGFAISLDYGSLSAQKVTEALNEILNNKKYSQNAKQLSKLMKDRPMKPLDTAMYWIEYVGRHKGVHHLKSAALDLYWYQLLLLDVLAVLGLVALLGVFVLKMCLKKCCRLLCSKSADKQKQSKKDKKNK